MKSAPTENIRSQEHPQWDTVREKFFPAGFPTVWEAENFKGLMKGICEKDPKKKAALRHMLALSLQGQCDHSRKNYRVEEAARRLSIIHREMKALGIPEGDLSEEEWSTLTTTVSEVKSKHGQSALKQRNDPSDLQHQIESLQNKISALVRQMLELERDLKALLKQQSKSR